MGKLIDLFILILMHDATYETAAPSSSFNRSLCPATKMNERMKKRRAIVNWPKAAKEMASGASLSVNFTALSYLKEPKLKSTKNFVYLFGHSTIRV